jgi:tetratricopeptide (TPR) repeat protein
MPRLAILSLLVLVSGAPVSAAIQQSPQDAERFLQRALELHQAGDLLGAIESYKAALAITPDRADALSNLGAAYVRLGQFDDAVKQYEAALKLDPLSSAIQMNLALAYYKSARPQLAIPVLKRVLASEPNAKNAYLILAECYLQTGQDDDAISLLKPRESMFEKDLAYAYILGTALLHKDDIINGQPYVDRVFGAGESAEAHLLLGMAYLSRQDYKSALPEVERAVKLNPKLPTVYSMYGRALLGSGNQEGAERAFRRELDLNINDFEANLQLGHLRRQAQKFDEASAYLERAVSIRPSDLTARRILASLRLQTGKTEEAVAMFEALVKDAPDFLEAHVQLATAYNRLKRTADADRERVIIDRLNAEAQAKQPGAKPPIKTGGDVQ